MADLCLCEYTDHGHCGVVTPAGVVDNDPTLDRYAAVAIAQAQAGAHVIAPSGMMDGQVAAIRGALDGAGEDRKSTRLNSSHANISYAVFCLKKKKNT